MRETYLDAPDDMEWLTNVHNVPAGMGCAILTGHHEDSPIKIEAWKVRNPHYQAAPDFIWIGEDQ